MLICWFLFINIQVSLVIPWWGWIGTHSIFPPLELVNYGINLKESTWQRCVRVVQIELCMTWITLSLICSQ